MYIFVCGCDNGAHERADEFQAAKILCFSRFI